ncbi:hypothetical protein F8568_021505 [Actinomadura sp. LD22]|uniref:Uncharacterized protein n=1 Tax=Actinomadura physcomitrii TaxID=2650748 RepID=A0A6I4MED4_9ACTN|nr:hypothetical protein [Actinomadura physcomitrii]MWA02905.1 hypothetical protein [Actinomadura physcomitrii]
MTQGRHGGEPGGDTGGRAVVETLLALHGLRPSEDEVAELAAGLAEARHAAAALREER